MSGPTAPGGPATSPFEAAVGARIDDLTTWRHQLVPPLLLGAAMLFDSWDAVVVAQTMPALLREWGFGPVIAGWLISAGFAGQFLGAFAFGPFAERYGRLPVLSVVLILMSALSILCAVVPTPWVMMGLRFFQGLAIGGALPIGATYISELAPSRVRGRFFATFQVFTMSGYAIAAVVGALVIPRFGWRWMFGLGATPLVLLPIILLVLPESPRWLARRGRFDAANRALARLGSATVPSEVRGGGAAGPAARAAVVSPLALFGAGYRKRGFSLLALWLMSSIVAFGISNWGPTIYTTVYHLPHATALSYVAISGFCYLGLSSLVGTLIDALGRRRLAIVCSGVSATSLATLAIVDPRIMPLPVLLLQIGSLGLSAMVTTILWPYSAEVFPTRLRATALGFFSSMNRLPSMFVPVLIGGILSATGSILPVYALFTFCGIGVTLVWLLVAQETSGRTLEELEHS